MKKSITLFLLIIIILSLSSCSSMVSYIRFPSDQDDTRYGQVFEVECKLGDDTVIFYADEDLYDIEIVDMKYDEQTGQYTELETIWNTDLLKKGDGIKIYLQLSREIPYVMVRYTRQNSEIREQFIYMNPKTEKLWLIEQYQ